MPRQHEQRPTLGVTQHPYGDARQKAERGKAPGKAWIIRPLIQAGFTRPHGVQRGGTFLFLSGAAVPSQKQVNPCHAQQQNRTAGEAGGLIIGRFFCRKYKKKIRR